MYFALCEPCAKLAKYGKVRNFEGHLAGGVESAHNGLNFWPHIEKFIRSSNMQSIYCSGSLWKSCGKKQHAYKDYCMCTVGHTIQAQHTGTTWLTIVGANCCTADSWWAGYE